MIPLCVLSMKLSSPIVCRLTIISGTAATVLPVLSGLPTGLNRVSAYSSAPVIARQVPVAQKTNLPGDWTYAGCLREPATGKIFPYQITWIGNNSAVACMNQCAAFGYPASGVEVSYKACYEISELTSLLIFSPLYLVWTRMLCVSDASYISHTSLNDY